jgi:hypothetical protein
MPLYRITVLRTQLLSAVVEAEDAEEAHELAAHGRVDYWEDATGGRGEDEYDVRAVEDVTDEYGEKDADQ